MTGEVKCVSGYDVYKGYNALKTHFNQDAYDYHKYGGKSSVCTLDAFHSRKDRWHYEKIAKKYDAQFFPYLLSNLVNDKKYWVGSWNKESTHKVYHNWVRYIDAKENSFKSDLTQLRTICDEKSLKFDDLFTSDGGKHPPIFIIEKQNHIHYCTMVIFDSMINFSRVVDSQIPSDPIWKAASVKMNKTKGFIQTTKKMKEDTVNMFSDVST